jgi:hypothetical protein
LRVWDVATPDERQALRAILARKALSLREQPPEEQTILLPKLRAALAK